MSYGVAYALLAIIWGAAALGGGALLALLARRMHPALSFRKLWVFYSALLACSVAAVLAIGLL
jgi:hypothetical protein